MFQGHLKEQRAWWLRKQARERAEPVPVERAQAAQPRVVQAARRGQASVPESAEQRPLVLLEHWRPLRTMPLWTMSVRALVRGRAEPAWLAALTRTELAHAPVVWAGGQAPVQT